MSDHFYTSSEARAKLGNMASSTFHRLVVDGQIRKVTPPGKKHGLYVGEDVDAFARTMMSDRRGTQDRSSEDHATPERPSVTVDWMLPTDLPSILALDMQVYQEELIGNISLYYAWAKKNNRTTLVAFETNNRSKILAQACLLPVAESVILSVLRGERAETSITAEEVQTYDEPGDYTLLAESIISHPDYHEYIGAIMRRFAEFWCDLWPERKIRRIYAQAVSAEGRYFVQKLYFGPLYDLAENAFVLDLRYPNASRFIRRFQECIAARERNVANPDANSDASANERGPTRTNSTTERSRLFLTSATTDERA